MSNFEEKTDTQNQGELFLGEHSSPGCLDLDTIVRSALNAAFKTLSREQVAEQLSHLVGADISVAMLNAFTADSKRHHRFPAAWIPAFCIATGDSRLLQYLVQRMGFRMITTDEAKYMELGRKLVEQQIATRDLNCATEVLIAERISR